MSLVLADIDLSIAVIGTSGTIDFSSRVAPQSGLTDYAPGKTPHLKLYNESGCGLTAVFNGGAGAKKVPAGGWPTIALTPGDTAFTWTVTYVLPNAPVALLSVVYFAPGEEIDDTGPLGNSPIGITGAVETTTVNQVINSGNPAPTTVIQGQPSGAASAQLQWNNDGSGTFGGGNDVVNNAGVFTSMAADAIPVAAVGPGALDADVTIGGAQVTSAVASATSATSATQLTADATHRVVASWLAGSSRLQFGPDANVFPQAVGLFYMDASGTRRVAFIGNSDNSGSVGGPFGLSLAWDSSGNLKTIGGQAAAGFGAPVIIAQALNVHVISTATTNIVQVASLPATGLYRISGHIALGAGGGAPLFRTSYIEPNVGTGIAFGISQGPSGGKLLDGTEPAIGGLTPVPMTPIVVYAQAATTLTVLYQNTTGTPSDFISALIERLA